MIAFRLLESLFLFLFVSQTCLYLFLAFIKTMQKSQAIEIAWQYPHWIAYFFPLMTDERTASAVSFPCLIQSGKPIP